MTFLVTNPFSGEHFEFDNEVSANIKADEIRADALAREAYRFTVVKEVVTGNDTTWLHADLNNDHEVGVYHVFNTFTGQHEKVDLLSKAEARIAELKAEFLNSLPLVSVIEAQSVAQPISEGVQTL